MKRIRSIAILLALLATGIFPCRAQVQYNPAPKTFLWAWQHAENLEFLNPHKFGVAYMACRTLLSGDRALVSNRTQPLHVSKQTVVMPVIRVDVDDKQPPTFSAHQLDELARNVINVSRIPRSSGVQIDFDARLSERSFYRSLIARVRNEVQVPLSITSLASWCLFDDWIKNLPVDESVPMMFSLGAERQKILLYFKTNREFLHERCLHSLGISLEDSEVNALMIPLLKRRKMQTKLYVFTKTGWNESKVEQLESLLGMK